MNKAILLTVVLLSAFPLCQAEVRYTITDLGTLGGACSEATGINDRGQVVGRSCLTGDAYQHAFLYDGTTMHDLGTLGGSESLAYAINNSGQVVGGSKIDYGWGDSIYHPFLYDGTMMHNLGTFNGLYSSAYAINESGQVVGYGSVIGVSGGAFFYDGLTMHDLGTLGGTRSYANGINDSGQVVGESHIAGDSACHAFYYDGTVMHDLGTLGGNDSWAYDINNSGKVVGHSFTIGGSSQHAFFYDGSTMHDLGTLGGTNSFAHAINDKGQIVGTSYIAGDSAAYGFLYDDGCMIDLNDLLPVDSGWESVWPFDINNSGQIVGMGKIGGKEHAFLLTPLLKPIQVDIKPQSCPNPINVKSKGVLPVAILGSDVLDVNDINIDTVLLEGVSPIRSRYKDETAPVVDGQECECHSKKKDGYIDLSLKFDTQEIVATLGEVSDGDTWMLHLTGFLQDGTEIEGTDCILIKKKGKK